MRITVEIDGREETVELSDDTFRELTAIAARNEISFGAALEQAVANENFLEAQQAAGGKLLIEKDAKLHEVIRDTKAA